MCASRVKSGCAQSYAALSKGLQFQGFDEFMNLVVDDAVEVNLTQKDKQGKEIPETRRQLGMVLYCARMTRSNE